MELAFQVTRRWALTSCLHNNCASETFATPLQRPCCPYKITSLFLFWVQCGLANEQFPLTNFPCFFFQRTRNNSLNSIKFPTCSSRLFMKINLRSSNTYRGQGFKPQNIFRLWFSEHHGTAFFQFCHKPIWSHVRNYYSAVRSSMIKLILWAMLIVENFKYKYIV